MNCNRTMLLLISSICSKGILRFIVQKCKTVYFKIESTFPVYFNLRSLRDTLNQQKISIEYFYAINRIRDPQAWG
jgi:hypothetical protein